MKQFDAKVISNKKIGDSFFELVFSWEADENPLPGQFLTIRVSEDTAPLLRRPFAFSAFSATERTSSIIYQLRGRGTDILTGKQPGDILNIIGPLGKELPLPSQQTHSLLVAGGIGIGPILFFATSLKNNGYPSTLIFGCRTKSFIPSVHQFTEISPVVCTDDGSSGFKGTTADYIRQNGNIFNAPVTIYCCGPHPMLRACHEIANNHNVPCWISVEQIMACGVGACMGCAVKVKGEQTYARACKEGPVFPSTMLVWE